MGRRLISSLRRVNTSLVRWAARVPKASTRPGALSRLQEELAVYGRPCPQSTPSPWSRQPASSPHVMACRACGSCPRPKGARRAPMRERPRKRERPFWNLGRDRRSATLRRECLLPRTAFPRSRVANGGESQTLDSLAQVPELGFVGNASFTKKPSAGRWRGARPRSAGRPARAPRWSAHRAR